MFGRRRCLQETWCRTIQVVYNTKRKKWSWHGQTPYLPGPRVCIHLNLLTLNVFQPVKYIIIVLNNSSITLKLTMRVSTLRSLVPEIHYFKSETRETIWWWSCIKQIENIKWSHCVYYFISGEEIFYIMMFKVSLYNIEKYINLMIIIISRVVYFRLIKA